VVGQHSPPRTTRSYVLDWIEKYEFFNTCDDFLEWKATAAAALDLKASIICIQEPNLQWQHQITTRIKSIFRQTFKQPIYLTTSGSKDEVKDESDTSVYQPSGTFIRALGTWVVQVMNLGTDLSRMGCWSFLEFQEKSGKWLIILSGYCACTQQPQLALITYYNQQYRLIQAGQANPNQQEQFITDLITQIWQWHTSGWDIILCMLVNEFITTSIGRLMMETDLIDLQHSQILHHPRLPTNNHGPYTIDVILGNPQLLPHIMATALLPFGLLENFSSDHHTVVIDFDSQFILGNHQHTTPLHNLGVSIAMPNPPYTNSANL